MALFGWEVAPLRWSFAFGLGDIVSLIFASAAGFFAYRTYKIQERQEAIEEQLRERNDTVLRDRLIRAGANIVVAYFADEEPEEKFFTYINENWALIEILFEEDEQKYFKEINKHKTMFGLYRKTVVPEERKKMERTAQMLNKLLIPLLKYL